MSVYYQDEHVTLYHGDCIDVLASLPDTSVDAVVTDPPYGINFMGKDWDRPMLGQISTGHEQRGAYAYGGTHSRGYADNDNRQFQAWCEQWATECLRVLKPGGHMVAFGGTRTFHRLTAGIEDAGFEVRDVLSWLYGSGFPKSRNIGPETGGAWDGWGTALKPAWEPVVLARKPLAGTVAGNVLTHGTGALNIDACRVGDDERINQAGSASSLQRVSRVQHGYRDNITEATGSPSTVTGRFPANVVLDDTAAAALDAQTGTLKSGILAAHHQRTAKTGGVLGDYASQPGARGYGDEGGASRFFYSAKADTSERPVVDGVAHPTVKPLALMEWLIQLVTPPGGTVLEPFAGSGTTLEAAQYTGHPVIGIEKGDEYLPLIRHRLERADPRIKVAKVPEVHPDQLDMLDLLNLGGVA